MNITATELKHRLGRYIDAALKEPVFIEKNGRNSVVMLSYAEYEHLQTLEDAYWGEKALKALERGKFVDGWAVLERLAKEKGVAIETPPEDG